jgi:tRNA threonylcarbamoyladenosine biosynthesis protein TsaE
MATRTTVTATPEATEEVGLQLAGSLRAGDLILLEGDLAAGKTTLVRGLLQGLGGEAGEVSSPSFVIVQTYPCCSPGIDRLHHVDLFRLDDNPAALRETGLEELLSDPSAVLAIEWPRGPLEHWLPADARRWRVCLTVLEDDSRRVEIERP